MASNSFDKTIGKNNQLINRDMVHLIGCLEALADQVCLFPTFSYV